MADKEDGPKAAPQTEPDLATQMEEATKATELEEPDADASPVDRFINKIVEVVGVTILASIVFLVFFNAVGRYAFNYTFIWADEMVIGVLPWLGMCGMFLSIRRRQVIRLEFFVAMLPQVLHRPISLMAYVLAASVFVYLAFVSIDFVQLFGADRTIYLRLPKGWFTSALVIGSALAALAYAVEFIRDLRNRTGTRVG